MTTGETLTHSLSQHFFNEILCFFKYIHILLLFIIDIKEQQNDPQQEQTKYDDAQ